MEKQDPGQKWTGKTTFQQLRHMTMIPRYAVMPENVERIWELGEKLILESGTMHQVSLANS